MPGPAASAALAGWDGAALRCNPVRVSVLLLAVQNFHDAVGGILAVVVELALPDAKRRCPPETIALEKCPGFVVRLAVELELNTHCFGVLPVGVAVVLIFHGLCGLGRFQLCNTVLCPLDAGIAVLQLISRERTAVDRKRGTAGESMAVFKPVSGLFRDAGAIVKCFVLAVAIV